MRTALLAVTLAALIAPAGAAVRDVTLALPSMDCPTCPITLKIALNRVAGVERTEVDFERRRARVRFDDAKTTVDALTRATKNAGYPSTVVHD